MSFTFSSELPHTKNGNLLGNKLLLRSHQITGRPFSGMIHILGKGSGVDNEAHRENDSHAVTQAEVIVTKLPGKQHQGLPENHVELQEASPAEPERTNMCNALTLNLPTQRTVREYIPVSNYLGRSIA